MKIKKIILLTISLLFMPSILNAEHITVTKEIDCINHPYACVICAYEWESKVGKYPFYSVQYEVYSDGNPETLYFVDTGVTGQFNPHSFVGGDISAATPSIEVFKSGNGKLSCPENMYLYIPATSKNKVTNSVTSFVFDKSGMSQELNDYMKIGSSISYKEVKGNLLKRSTSEYNAGYSYNNGKYIDKNYKETTKTITCPIETINNGYSCTYGNANITSDGNSLLSVNFDTTKYNLFIPGLTQYNDYAKYFNVETGSCPTNLAMYCDLSLQCSLTDSEYVVNHKSSTMCTDNNTGSSVMKCIVDMVDVNTKTKFDGIQIETDGKYLKLNGPDYLNKYDVTDKGSAMSFFDTSTQTCPTIALVCDQSTYQCFASEEGQYLGVSQMPVTIFTPPSEGNNSVISSKVGFCVDYLGSAKTKGSIANLLDRIYTIIKVIAIILAIILSMMDLVSAVTSGKSELKPVLQKIIKRVVVVLVILLLPTIIDIVFGLFGYKEVLCGIR